MLDVDPGEATNRTVVTFVGEPDDVVEAAFRAVGKAAQLIDMRQHHGAHPRIGATDVLPIVPVSGITLEECAEISRQLAKRIADELNIPCYCYEAAAFKPERKNLAVCRKGEYEGIAERIDDDAEAPDFGRRPFARYAEVYQGYRMVYRRVWHRPGVDEHHQYQCNAAAQGVRRGVPLRSEPRRARYGHRDCGSRAGAHPARSRSLLPR